MADAIFDGFSDELTKLSSEDDERSLAARLARGAGLTIGTGAGVAAGGLAGGSAGIVAPHLISDASGKVKDAIWALRGRRGRRPSRPRARYDEADLGVSRHLGDLVSAFAASMVGGGLGMAAGSVPGGYAGYKVSDKLLPGKRE